MEMSILDLFPEAVLEVMVLNLPESWSGHHCRAAVT